MGIYDRVNAFLEADLRVSHNVTGVSSKPVPLAPVLGTALWLWEEERTGLCSPPPRGFCG